MSILTSCTFASKFDESVMFIWDHVEDERQVKRWSACRRHNHTPSRLQTVVLMESEILHTVELIKPRHLRRMKRSEMKTAARKKNNNIQWLSLAKRLQRNCPLIICRAQPDVLSGRHTILQCRAWCCNICTGVVRPKQLLAETAKTRAVFVYVHYLLSQADGEDRSCLSKQRG